MARHHILFIAKRKDDHNFWDLVFCPPPGFWTDAPLSGTLPRPAGPGAQMEACKIWLGPEVETVEAVNYFGMDMGKLAVGAFTHDVPPPPLPPPLPLRSEASGSHAAPCRCSFMRLMSRLATEKCGRFGAGIRCSQISTHR